MAQQKIAWLHAERRPFWRLPYVTVVTGDAGTCKTHNVLYDSDGETPLGVYHLERVGDNVWSDDYDQEQIKLMICITFILINIITNIITNVLNINISNIICSIITKCHYCTSITPIIYILLCKLLI